MAILESDIKILASQVLDDVPEGGGAATGNEIVDGVSNNLFPDVSDLDGIYGAVSMRKVFPAVRSPDNSSYFGAHIIVADQPADQRVSALIMSTGDHYDQRVSAQNRIEAYLAIGPVAQGLLFGNHIAGMRTISMLAEISAVVPSNGMSLVLNRHDTLGPTSFQQFVRITGVDSRVVTFVDDAGEFQKRQIDIEISDPLRNDYAGFEAQRKNTGISFVGKGRVHTVVVADAARYYGASKLAIAASMNDFGVVAESIYAQLVPSAQTETPIIDARMNQRQVVLVPSTGDLLTRSVQTNLGPNGSTYVGGAITPGTLNITYSSIVLTDRDGFLVNGSDNVVGAVDYANGAVSSTGGTGIPAFSNASVQYRPAGGPQIAHNSLGRDVTEANRSLTWVVTLDPAPARGSVEVHFRAGGQWYVLRDGGTGGLRGSDAAFGAGQVNFDTGSVSVTLGALPDVGSVVLFFYNAGLAQALSLAPLDLLSGPKVAFVTDAFRSLQPGSLSVTIPGDASSGTGTAPATPFATISGGAFTGTIDHPGGDINVTLTTLPAPGSQIQIAAMGVSSERTVSGPVPGGFTDGGSTWNGTLAAGGFTEGSIAGSVDVTYQAVEFPGGTVTKSIPVRFRSNSVGEILTSDTSILPINTVIGSTNAGAGTITLNKSLGSITIRQPKYRQYYGVSGVIGSAVPGNVLVGYENVSVPVSIANPSASATASHTVVEAATPFNATFTLSSLTIKTSVARGKVITSGTTFRIGSSTYVVNDDGSVVRNVVGTTGASTPAGSVVGSEIRVTSWDAGVSCNVTHFRGVQATPIAASERDDYIDSVVFRTAISPIRPESFNVSGTFHDGTTFSAFADEDGIIDSTSPPAGSNPGTPGVMGTVDVTTGVVTLRFGSKTDASTTPATNDMPVGSAATWGPSWSTILSGSQGLRSKGVRADTLRYNASAYSYIPLDADIIGLDAVRLPSDGRVPIFRKGSVVVVHHTGTTAPVTVAASDTINCGRERLARVRVIGSDGNTIQAGYAVDLDAGTVTFSDVAGYAQPVRVEHRIEDGALVTDAQINGKLVLARPLTHDFPIGSHVSSALLIGDMRARVSHTFDQVSWTNVWSDTLIGTDTLANFDTVNSPIEVTNDGAITERWALIFTNTTAFQIVGEHLGVVGTGTVGAGAAPLNPVNGEPYMVIPPAGFGSGWSTGNVLRINTVAAAAPVWVVRTVRPGPRETNDDRFTLIVRGGIDA